MTEPTTPPIAHTPPKDFPTASFTAVAVPSDFARCIAAAAARDGILFEDQLLRWAIMGAEHSRLCKDASPGRKK